MRASDTERVTDCNPIPAAALIALCLLVLYHSSWFWMTAKYVSNYLGFCQLTHGRRPSLLLLSRILLNEWLRRCKAASVSSPWYLPAAIRVREYYCGQVPSATMRSELSKASKHVPEHTRISLGYRSQSDGDSLLERLLLIARAHRRRRADRVFGSAKCCAFNQPKGSMSGWYGNGQYAASACLQGGREQERVLAGALLNGFYWMVCIRNEFLVRHTPFKTGWARLAQQVQPSARQHAP